MPQFLLERLAERRDHGRMDGAAVYVDLVGFTAMGDALARHGPHGAEIVADIVQSAMIPIVDAIHGEGGFVAAFPGDAVLAVFPGGRTQRALAAAEAIRDAVRAIGRRETVYGSFAVAARVGVGAGDLRWGVLRASAGKRCTYFVGGTAPASAVEAEGTAAAGEVVVHASVGRASSAAVRLCECPPEEVLESLATGFVDPDLLANLGAGEFRPVTAAFIGIPQPELHRVIADVFALQDRHGGHLDPVEIGDKGCVLRLVWGAPVRYEGDDERALRLLDELRRRHPAARAGITLGTAFAGFVGTPERKGFITYGSHVNLAARLMAKAAPGEVLLSSTLASRVRGSFALRAVGAHGFKGFSAPVEVEALVEPRSLDRVAGGFVGRAGELAALEGFLAAGCGMAVIRGPAGIGKSALVAEARRRFGDRARWLAAGADPVSRGALQPLRHVASEVLGQPRRLDATVAILRLDAHRGYLRALVGLPDPAYEQAEPRARARGTLDALIALFRALSAQRPLVLQLDDLHWSDLETLAFLPELLAALADRPFALVVTTRDAVSLGDVTLDLPVGELASDDLAALGETVLDEPLAPETCTWLAERTRCNPFFAQQVLLHMRECGHLAASAAGLCPTAAGEGVPPTVDAVVVARLDGLPSELRRVIRSAAVLGTRADEQELAGMLEAPADELARLVGTAADYGVWTRADGTLEFAHALVRDAVYGTLPLARRRELHALAAGVIEARHADLGPHLHRLANHHANAGAFDRARACERGAADRALGLGAYREAGRYAESGLAVGAAADGEERGLWLALAASRMITYGQGAPETKAAYDQAAALAGEAAETREGFRALFGLRTFYLFRGDHPRSLEMAVRSLAVASGSARRTSSSRRTSCSATRTSGSASSTRRSAISNWPGWRRRRTGPTSPGSPRTRGSPRCSRRRCRAGCVMTRPARSSWHGAHWTTRWRSATASARP